MQRGGYSRASDATSVASRPSTISTTPSTGSPSTETVRQTPTSYFSLPSSYVSSSTAGPSNWRNKPLESSLLLDQKGSSTDSNVGIYGSLNARSGGTSFSVPKGQKSATAGNRIAGLDNWQSLHDLTGGHGEQGVEADESRASIGRLPSPSAHSGKNIKSFLTSLPQTQSRPVDIEQGQGPSYTGAITSAQISTSPSQIESGFAYSPFLTPDDESTPRMAFKPLPSPEANASPLGGAYYEGGSIMSADVSSPQSDPKLDQALPHKAFLDMFWKSYWPPPLVAIDIFKCSFAYLIASLFTFVPVLASLLSTQSETDAHGRVTSKPAYSSHMVATIVVYFNPAKSLGNMILSTRYCLVLASLAFVVSLASEMTIHIFDHYSPSHGESWDWISELGDWVVCVLWIGGTMGLLAWSKLWVGNPSFNSGCSMAAMILYTVVIKEGSFPKLVEILLIVLTGVCITNIVCYTIFPVSATSNLQKSIAKSLDSFSTLFDLLTSTFLLSKSNVKGGRTTLKDAVKNHSTAFKTLQKDLAEAKNERIVNVGIRGRKLQLYDAAVVSLGRLAQHLSSLRSSTRLQESLILASREGKVFVDFGDNEQSLYSLSMPAIGQREGQEAGQGVGLDVPEVDIAMSVKLFVEFRNIAGAHMDVLNCHCEKALGAVQVLAKSDQIPQIDFPAIRADLERSLKDFTLCSGQAIRRVYAGPRRKRGIRTKSRSEMNSCASPESDDEDSSDGDDLTSGQKHEVRTTGENNLPSNRPQLDDGPNETVFWIYSFLFTFEEFARELLFLLDTMEEIINTQRISAWRHVREAIFSKKRRREGRREFLYKQLQNIVPIDPSRLQPPLYPKNTLDAVGPVTVPRLSSLTWIGQTKQILWSIGERLKQPDARYAIKTGLGGAILAAPAYTEIGRPIFLRYRGEWALIAYFATMSQTIGQTNFLSMARILGTLIGAGVAVVFTELFPDNNVVLPILGFLFSIPCFYVITQKPDYTNAGRFVLLTYNLTCLYTYNTRSRGDTTVEVIAYRRATGVIAGVLWAAIVSRYWWPFTARRELRMGLSDFFLDLSYLYSKLVAIYSKGIDRPKLGPRSPEAGDSEDDSLLPPGPIRHPHLSPDVRQFMAMELHLQSQLSNLKGLLSHTKNEPRLKGPFAYDYYNEVLLSCERMLDRLHSMRCVTTRDEWDDGIRQAFVIPVNEERRAMAGNVILYFYTLSAGFRLRTPVPPYLPPAEASRQNLLNAIRSLDVVKRRSVKGGGRDLLFFAYALAMQEVIGELDYLGAMMQDAFGVISHYSAENFEDLFKEQAEIL